MAESSCLLREKEGKETHTVYAHTHTHRDIDKDFMCLNMYGTESSTYSVAFEFDSRV